MEESLHHPKCKEPLRIVDKYSSTGARFLLSTARRCFNFACLVDTTVHRILGAVTKPFFLKGFVVVVLAYAIKCQYPVIHHVMGGCLFPPHVNDIQVILPTSEAEEI